MVFLTNLWSVNLFGQFDKVVRLFINEDSIVDDTLAL